MSEVPQQPRRLTDGGDGSAEQSQLGQLLRRVREPEPDFHAPGRVWAGIRDNLTGRKSLWWVFGLAACAASLIAVVVVMRGFGPADSHTASRLLMAAGDVRIFTAAGAEKNADTGRSLAPGWLLKTGRNSRAHLALANARLVVGAATELRLLGRRQVHLLSGDLHVSAANDNDAVITVTVQDWRVLGTSFGLKSAAHVTISAIDNLVRVKGAGSNVSLTAGQCWSSEHGAVVSCASASVQSPGDSNKPEEAAPPVEAPPVRRKVRGRAAAHLATRRQAKEPSLAMSPEERLARLRTQLKAAGSEERGALLYRIAVLLSRLGRYAEAASTFAQIVELDGTRAETALYEIARLRAKRLDDPKGATIALKQYRQRFANGSLRHEVDLTLIEVLVAQKHFAPALQQLNQFIETYKDSERRWEVLGMRADLLRRQGDCTAALSDYETIVSRGSGKPVESALYYGAVCMAEIGQPGRARAQLNHYIERYPTGRFRSQASKALGAQE